MKFVLLLSMSHAFVGNMGPVRKVMFSDRLNVKGEHIQLFDLMRHPNVSNKLASLHGGEDLQVVEYQTQVVAGIKYRVILENISNTTKYELNIWQKPFNSIDNKMPPPEVLSFHQLEEVDL